MGGTMSSITINGDTSGSVILQAPSVAGSTTLTLPTTSGTVLTTTSGQWITTGSDIYYNTGNVGIGTSSPAAKFQVNGAIRTTYSGDTNYYGTFNNATGAVQVYANGDSAPLLFGTTSVGGSTATERMRIDSSGNVLIGKTSVIASGSNILQIENGDGAGQIILNNTRSSGNQYMEQFYRLGTLVGSIQTSTSATLYMTSSDYRLKENIVPMTGALDKVAQLKPVTYTWKSDGSEGQGFIAHELAEIIPDCVAGDKDAVDEDGKPIYQGVDTSFLVATLTAAIKELKAELDELKAKIG